MDYNLDSENKGFAKGPFFGAAAFIFIIIALFASIYLQEQGTLGHWQIATCLLGTSLIAVLLCLPYFLEELSKKLKIQLVAMIRMLLIRHLNLRKLARLDA